MTILAILSCLKTLLDSAQKMYVLLPTQQLANLMKSVIVETSVKPRVVLQIKNALLLEFAMLALVLNARRMELWTQHVPLDFIVT